MRKLIAIISLALAACTPSYSSVKLIDANDQSYLVTTKDKEAGVYKLVAQEGICRNDKYAIKSQEQKIDDDKTIFYDNYTIICLLNK